MKNLFRRLFDYHFGLRKKIICILVGLTTTIMLILGVVAYSTIQRIITNFQKSFDLEIPVTRLLIKIKEDVITRRDYLETFLLSSDVEELGPIVKKYGELSQRVDRYLAPAETAIERAGETLEGQDRLLPFSGEASPLLSGHVLKVDAEIKTILLRAKGRNLEFDRAARNLMINRLKVITLNKDVHLIHNGIEQFFNRELKRIAAEEKGDESILSQVALLRRLESATAFGGPFHENDLENLLNKAVSDVQASGLKEKHKSDLQRSLNEYRESLLFLRDLQSSLALHNADHERIFKEVQIQGNRIIEFLSQAEEISTSNVLASIRDNTKAGRRSLAVILITWVLSLAISIALSIIIIKKITDPLIRLSIKAKDIANGIFGKEPVVGGKDEIALLIETFNQMSQTLERQIGELKDANKKLFAQEKLAAIGEITTGIAHEIRNPLSAVKMNIQILSKKYDYNMSDREYWEILTKEVNRLDRIVNETLEYSQMPELSRTWCDLHRMIAESKGILCQSEHERISFVESYDPEIPMMYVDEGRLQQVFLNILINSSQAMAGEEKWIGISTTLLRDNGDRLVRITLSDRGRGIGKDDLEKVFDPFFSTKTKGIGLGLAISKRIVEEHGGHIEAVSGFFPEEERGRSEGWNTQFKITLPLGEGS